MLAGYPVGGMPDADPAAAFDALGEELRVSVLRALVEHRRDNPAEPALSFSELRRRVGAEDSGRFNYHLGKLRDRFVEKTDDGYELTYAGEQMVTAVLSGAVADRASLGPAELDDDCPMCDTRVEVAYSDGRVTVECEENHALLETQIPPTLAEERDIEAVLSVAVQKTYDAISLAKEEVCHACYGPVDAGIETTDYEGEPLHHFRATCERCGELYSASVAITLLDHPAFVGYLWEHGIDPSSEYPWLLGFLTPEHRPTVESEDPLELRMTVELAGDEFEATIDERGRVVDTAGSETG